MKELTIVDISTNDKQNQYVPKAIDQNLEVIEKLELDVVMRNGHQVLSHEAEKKLMKFFLRTKKGMMSPDIINSLTNHNYIFKASLADALKETISRENDVEIFHKILMTESVTSTLKITDETVSVVETE